MLRLLTLTERGEFEPWALAMFVIALGTGLRRGELLALNEEQFELNIGLLIVDRAVSVLERGQQEIDLPKRNKTRVVVLAPTLCEWINAYLETSKEARKESPLLFPSGKGTPKMMYQQSKAWNEAKRLAKLPESMVLHDCRLTHNNWIEKLMPEVPTSTRLAHMGHASAEVNIRNYTREIVPARRILRDSLERLVNGKL